MPEELRRAALTWVRVVGRGAAYVDLLVRESPDAPAFALRFFTYIQLASAAVGLAAMQAARARPLAYLASYMVQGYIETLGVIAIVHFCFRALDGRGPFRTSAAIICLFSAFSVITTALMVPLQLFFAPFMQLDPLDASFADTITAMLGQITPAGLLLPLLCGLGALAALLVMWTGIIRSLRTAHGIDGLRTFVAISIASLGMLLYVGVLSLVLGRLLYLP